MRLSTRRCGALSVKNTHSLLTLRLVNESQKPLSQPIRHVKLMQYILPRKACIHYASCMCHRGTTDTCQISDTLPEFSSRWYVLVPVDLPSCHKHIAVTSSLIMPISTVFQVSLFFFEPDLRLKCQHSGLRATGCVSVSLMNVCVSDEHLCLHLKGMQKWSDRNNLKCENSPIVAHPWQPLSKHVSV